MKTGKYTLREFFSDRDLNTIIVPEIQRDYVWGKEQIERFLDSIIDDFNAFKGSTPIKEIDNVSSEIVDSYNEFYKKNYLSSNIGFIYAYSDSDYPGSYFLIDGQQRFTTIFLTLLVLAANGDDEQLKKFNRVFLNEDKPKLDYRVREASHIFLYKLVQTIGLARNELSSKWIKEQSWYLQDYDNDTTISSIIRNIDVVTGFLKEKDIIKTDVSSVDKAFVEYVEDYLEFWYFDTNISEQGEELYIYMNARGESMQEHENLKADLIGKLKDSEKKKEYGAKWEQWQDLFWRNKGENANADKGFNEFLCCIAGLSNRNKKIVKEYTPDDFKKASRGTWGKIAYDDLIKCIDISEIGRYVDGLDNLFSEERIQTFKVKYPCYKWVDFDWIADAKKRFWNTINSDEPSNWFAEGENINKYMNYVWAVLKYSSLVNDWDDVERLYRTLRLFYIRMNNNNRRIQEIQKSISVIIEKGPWDEDVLLTEEERKKYGFLKEMENDAQIKSEAVLWEIENHPLNLDGSEDNRNCSHLVEFEKNPSVVELQNIYDSFCIIFPIGGDKKIAHPRKLLNALLYTSVFNCEVKPFWDKHDTGYYERLFFNTERRYIRGLSTYGTNEVFKTFFRQFVRDRNYMYKTINDIEDEMRSKGVTKDKVDSLTVIWALVWYAAAKETSIWSEEKCFIYNYEYEGTGNKDLLDKDKNFPSLNNLVKCNGSVRNYTSLSSL